MSDPEREFFFFVISLEVGENYEIQMLVEIAKRTSETVFENDGLLMEAKLVIDL